MAYAAIVNEVIDVPALTERVSGVDNGAVCVFIGQVRRNSRGREVAYLEYQAYAPMAAKQLLRIAEEAEAKWGCEVGVEHRVGRMELCEASVVVVAGSRHRAQAFEACRYCIDTLKERVPIWKKEVCPDGSFWIEGEEAIEVSDVPRETGS